jgi:hypothetical protein
MSVDQVPDSASGEELPSPMAEKRRSVRVGEPLVEQRRKVLEVAAEKTGVLARIAARKARMSCWRDRDDR